MPKIMISSHHCIILEQNNLQEKEEEEESKSIKFLKQIKIMSGIFVNKAL